MPRSLPHKTPPRHQHPGQQRRPDVSVPPIDSGTCPTGATLVVNEVQSDGATAADEFVELHNPNDCVFPLAGWTLRYSSAGASNR